MDRYFIYQEEDGTLKRREIKDLEKAKELVKLGKAKLDGKSIHIVGIGTEEDFRKHKEILGQTDGPAKKQLALNIEYFKKYKKWPSNQ